MDAVGLFLVLPSPSRSEVGFPDSAQPPNHVIYLRSDTEESQNSNNNNNNNALDGMLGPLHHQFLVN